MQSVSEVGAFYFDTNREFGFRGPSKTAVLGDLLARKLHAELRWKLRIFRFEFRECRIAFVPVPEVELACQNVHVAHDAGRQLRLLSFDDQGCSNGAENTGLSLS